jgi:hypothetical protein
MLRAAVLPAELAARGGAADRGDPGARPAHGHQPAADHRARPRAAVRQLPSRAEPRRLERTGGGAGAAGPAARRLRAEGAGGPRARPHHRAPARQAHRRQGDLPRPGALVEVVLRQGHWVALVEPGAAGPDPLGRAGLGPAVPDRARALGALLPRARPTTQEADGLGQAAGRAGPPLDARTPSGAGGRQRLRRPRTPGGAGPAGRDLRHPAAPRRRPL